METVTVLSAGLVVNEMLSSDASIAAAVTKVFPVVVDQAILPYIAYRREGLETRPVKGERSADTARIAVRCYAATYAGSVELAEMVRAALDGATYRGDTLSMRSCCLVGGSETWEADAYVQELIFAVRI